MLMIPRMHPRPALLLAPSLIAGAACLAIACGDLPETHVSAASVPRDAAPRETTKRAHTSKTPNVQLAARRQSGERPLQAFSGAGLDAERLSISDFIGKRLTLFFFNPEVADASFVGDAVARTSELRGKHNFHVVGIAVGSTTSKARAFAAEKGFDFPIFDDSNGRIAQQLGLRNPVGLYGFDDEGYFDFGIGYFNPNLPDPAAVVEDQLREKLRLPAREREAAGKLDPRPTAPAFVTRELDRDEPFDSASFAGRPAVIIFFLHTCPHCHKALAFLKEQVSRLPEDQRPAVVAISAANRPSEVRAMLRELELGDFEDLRVLLDPDAEIMESYGVFAGFPDVFMLDADGTIVHRTQGWREDRDPALNRMVLGKITGTRIPMLLNPRGYTGSDVCSICHEVEAQTHVYTNHATAWSTIVKHGETRNPECVNCHVVGFDQPGGYSIEQAPAHLENVGCESCHGRGGPHLSPDFVPVKDGVKNYEAVCRSCHNPTHSLGFEFASFHPRVSHRRIAALDDEARSQLISADRGPRDVLPANADYVGSKACRSCHPSEYATWSASPHRKAVETLAAKNRADDAACLACHTTAMGRSGGFPKDGKGSDDSHGDLASVGCESCHGPGGNHIAPEAKKLGSIVSLGDKCDSCAILKICGSCHDDANDPGFEFEVEEKIERQRHGTIEAGTGKPLPGRPTAQHDDRPAAVATEVARVLRALEEGGS